MAEKRGAWFHFFPWELSFFSTGTSGIFTLAGGGLDIFYVRLGGIIIYTHSEFAYGAKTS